jgi:hypothetical protein
VLSYYGCDPETLKFVHVHVHYRVVLGRASSSTYYLPVEKPLLHSAAQNDVFRIPAAEFELVLLVVRTVQRYSLRDALSREPSWMAGVREQVEWLTSRSDPASVAREIGRHFPNLDREFFELCLDSCCGGGRRWRRLLLKRRLHRRLQAHARRPALSVVLGTWGRRVVSLGGYVPLPRRRKQFASGGCLVALVGADGAGKSTCAAAIRAWLAAEFDVMHAHLGRPPRSLPTLAVAALSRLVRLSSSDYVTGAGTADGTADGHGSTPLQRYLGLLYHLCIARDRYRLFTVANRFVAAGGVAICERYPIPHERELVGPRIASLLGTVPNRRWAETLSRIEQRYYDRIAREDLLIALHVDPEIAVARKTNEPPDYVRRRANIVKEIDWSATPARVIDAERPLAETLAELKSVIWAEL